MQKHQEPQPQTLPANSLERRNSAKLSETTEVLSRLLASFPERDSDHSAKLDRIHSYLVALEGFSVDVLQAAERQILKAQAPDLDPRFMPTPPQLARLCNDIQARRRLVSQFNTPQLERFMAPPDPGVVLKFEKITKQLAKVADAQSLGHESRRDWMVRMGDRIKPLA